MPEKWKTLLKSGKLTGMLIGAAALLALCIVFLPGSGKPEDEEREPGKSASAYTAELEAEIASMVTAITGEAAPHVTVTLRSMGETVYATEDRESARSEQEYDGEFINKSQTDGDTEKTYMLLKGAGGEQKPLIIAQTEPEVRGVVIVSRFGRDTQVREQIVLAVKTALDLSATQVCVTGSGEYT